MLPLTPILSTFKSGGGAVLNNVSVTVNMDKGSNGAPETSRGDGSSSSGRNSRGSSGPKSSTTTSADIGTKADVDGIATGTELTLVCDFARMGKATVARQAGGERRYLIVHRRERLELRDGHAYSTPDTTPPPSPISDVYSDAYTHISPRPPMAPIIAP